MIADGDRVILLEPSSGRRWLVQVAQGAIKQGGLGVFDPGRFIGMDWGAQVQVAGKDLVALRPSLPDLVATIRRKAAIILPKDSSRIVFEMGVGPGDRVLESGIGSGATTLALAWVVGDEGKVVVQELREDFRDWAMDNLAKAGLADRVEAHIGDLTEAVADGVEGPFDAVLLDQPEPWLAIPNLLPMLAPGARVVCYTPQVSQMENAANAMRDAGFASVQCMEIIEREWLVKERGSRPNHAAIGHTAFLVVGRHV